MLETINVFLINTRDSIPSKYQLLADLFIYTLVISLYALFIWKFYKFLARREIIKLNLKQYNYSSHPKLEKFIAILLYTIEYLIILPFLVLFWFVTLSAIFIVLSEQGEVEKILLISAAIITSVRITSYISEDLSRDLAKVFPFTVLIIYLLDPTYLTISELLERVVLIPSSLGSTILFLIFIFVVEFLLRVLYSISKLIKSNKVSLKNK